MSETGNRYEDAFPSLGISNFVLLRGNNDDPMNVLQCDARRRTYMIPVLFVPIKVERDGKYQCFVATDTLENQIAAIAEVWTVKMCSKFGGKKCRQIAAWSPADHDARPGVHPAACRTPDSTSETPLFKKKQFGGRGSRRCLFLDALFLNAVWGKQAFPGLREKGWLKNLGINHRSCAPFVVVVNAGAGSIKWGGVVGGGAGGVVGCQAGMRAWHVTCWLQQIQGDRVNTELNVETPVASGSLLLFLDTVHSWAALSQRTNYPELPTRPNFS
ncbi:hypothetical protein FPV67DRAFT_1443225 [Lyophyllum atratum]|nr:hypothetical protein FPV67DRAFT_1443225 [Lyophyllum atratum]